MSKAYELDSSFNKEAHHSTDAEHGAVPQLSAVGVNHHDAHDDDVDIAELIADVPLAGVRRVETVQAVWTTKSRYVLFTA